MIEKAKKAIDVNNLKKVVLARKVTQSHLLQPKAAVVISNLEQYLSRLFIFCNRNPKGKSYFVGATPGDFTFLHLLKFKLKV